MRDLLGPATDCPGLALRRLHAGELQGAAAARVRSHLERCERCTATWRGLDAERAALPPLASFRPGVERHLEAARAKPAPKHALRRLLPLALAASLAALVAVPLLRQAPPTATERIKGGAGLDVLVGGAGQSRLAAEGERLGPTDRVRLRVHPGNYAWALALSVDDAGIVTTLYDHRGTSLAVQKGKPLWLPDALAFEGEGAERIYLFLSEAPLATAELARALAVAHRSAGSAAAMATIPGVPGEQSHLLVNKP
ncbi:ACP synthase [Vulgatibacter sp.]|uniref:ACP synthase n=1 Tax=Vulgatibacter sp. TaxID=1971226 RepID=UPI00356864CA